MPNNIENFQNENKTKAKSFVKNKVYDIIGIGLVMALCALILDILQINILTKESILSTIADWIPFYMASTLLSSNYYDKGIANGKITDKFVGIVSEYSSTVASISGEKLRVLPKFCEEYNDNAIKSIQTQILKKEGIDIEEFRNGIDGKAPLMLITFNLFNIKKVCKKYGLTKRQLFAIRSARHVKVKGISDTILLSSLSTTDPTNIGSTEKQLSIRRKSGFSIRSIASTAFLTVIGVKQLVDWNWISLIFWAFKILYTLCRSYTKYFNGYNDITNDVANHIPRKTDILKQFDDWYDKYKTQKTTEKMQKITEKIPE